MPKTDTSFNPAEYAPVADRITHFYDRFPNGRIVTRLISRVDRGKGVFELTVRALVYRTADETHVAATGLASEREDDSDINALPASRTPKRQPSDARSRISGSPLP